MTELAYHTATVAIWVNKLMDNAITALAWAPLNKKSSVFANVYVKDER